MSPPIVIIGSINMDLVIRAPRMPEAGETLLGSDFQTIAGGKGANQAVAAARLGTSPVYMVGRVGADELGEGLRNGLAENGVEVSHVRTSRKTPSGCAMILVNDRGDNSIVVSPGANAAVSPADVDRAKPLIRKAAAVVLQLEIPLATAAYAIELCRRLGTYTILDPAPVPPKGLPRSLWNVDLLSPNQHEAELLFGKRGRGLVEFQRMAASFQLRGARTVVMKLGARGSMISDGADAACRRIAPFKVKAVDSTAAGDAFTAALAVARAEKMELEKAARFANAAGALTCTSFGAQPSLPSRRDVEKLLRRK